MCRNAAWQERAVDKSQLDCNWKGISDAAEFLICATAFATFDACVHRILIAEAVPATDLHGKREIYIKSPEPGAATSAKRVTYVGNGLRRREFLLDDAAFRHLDAMKVRYSEDNGRTWSEPTTAGPLKISNRRLSSCTNS